LDSELKTTSRMFEFVFKMLSEGSTSVPARGMGAILAQIAEKFSADAVLRLNSRVESLHENEITLAGGESMRARAIVVATDGPSAGHLIGEAEPASRSVSCFYYPAEEPPVPEAMLTRNGDGAGSVNNFAVMSQVAPSYAPAGKHLISASVLGTQELTEAQLSGFVIAQMKNWFGVVARSWRLLKIQNTACSAATISGHAGAWSVRVRPGIYVCGDRRDNASIDGAMFSGCRAAEAVIEDFTR
jgi:phytoene dehydrogenase-like protein